MATMPSEEQENLSHAESPAASSQLEGAPDNHLDIRSASSHSNLDIRSASSQSEGASESEDFPPSNVRETRTVPWFFPTRINVGGYEVPWSPNGEHVSISSESEGVWGVLEDGNRYRPLLRAIFRGDWESAKRFFEEVPGSKKAKITGRGETALHIAALSAHDQFLEKLVELLSTDPPELLPTDPPVLEMVDSDGRTALHIAVLCGRIRMVKALIRRNSNLTQLSDNNQNIPLVTCAQVSVHHKEIAWFLVKKTIDNGPSLSFESPTTIATVIEFTTAGHYDIVLYLVGNYRRLLSMKVGGSSILGALARADSQILCKNTLSVVEALIFNCIPVEWNYRPTDEYSTNPQASTNPALQCFTRSLWNAAKILVPKIKRIHEKKLRYVGFVELTKRVFDALSSTETSEIIHHFEGQNIFQQAIIKGNSEFFKIFIQFFPDIFPILPGGTKLMTRAVKYRQERILSLFLKVTSTNEFSLVPAPPPDRREKMMLAAVRKYSHFNVGTYIPGAAFQMQRELQWFNAVESWLFPRKGVFTFEGKTFWQIFVENHQGLQEEGEKWVKGTADKCMLVSTLIATVLFAAAFTVPGGNDDKTRVPLLLGRDSVLAFTISNALGLFSSITVILQFLAILTSRYEPQDFLHSLPEKIIMGLSFLFLSLAFMLVAFVATLKILLDKRLEWAFIPLTLLASLPVALFIRLQIPLLLQMVKSTYGRSIFRPEDIWK